MLTIDFLLHRDEVPGISLPGTEGHDFANDQGRSESGTSIGKMGGRGIGRRKAREVNEEMLTFRDGGYDFRLNEEPIYNATGVYSNVSIWRGFFGICWGTCVFVIIIVIFSSPAPSSSSFASLP